MDKGLEKLWDRHNIKISPSPIMWWIDKRIKQIDELTKDDNETENNYDSGKYDGLYNERNSLCSLNDMIIRLIQGGV